MGPIHSRAEQNLKMKKPLIIIYFLCTSLFANNCNDEVQNIYENIIQSIGNNSLFPPELIFSNTIRSVAFMSNEGITIEQKAIDLFCGTDHFEDKIAYILAHELAHYYLEHSWMRNTGLSYASSIGEFIEDTSYSVEQRKLAESQADLYAGFYGQIAGYNTLGFGEIALSKVYSSYGLPKDLKGYPSFSERLEIVNSKKDEANNLATVFELGNVLLKFKEYTLARDCYESILKSKFNSREIYNNLGLVYLLYGISMSDENVSNLLYPVYLDEQTRANTSKTRSGNFFDDPNKLFKMAQTHLEKAILLDPNYAPAQQNLFVSEILLEQTSEGRERVLKGIMSSELEPTSKVDFQIVCQLLNKVKVKKVKKIAKYGSYLSVLNTSNQMSSNLPVIDSEEILKKLGIDMMYLLMGNNGKNQIIRAGNIKFKSMFINKIMVFEHKTLFIFKLPKDILDYVFNEEEKSVFESSALGDYFVYKNK